MIAMRWRRVPATRWLFWRGFVQLSDCWIGAYWDADLRRLYVLPLPCIGLQVQL